MCSFFFNVTATTEIYTLSLHDALPILAHQHGLDQSAVIKSVERLLGQAAIGRGDVGRIQSGDRKSTRLNSSHVESSYAVFCLKKKKVLLAYSSISQLGYIAVGICAGTL